MPVIMVTARVEEIDRLRGVEIGADDYICKPFSPREVAARVQAVLPRHRHDPYGAPAPGLHIDEDACRASVDGRALDLTQVAFRLLRTLAAARGVCARASTGWAGSPPTTAASPTALSTATSRTCAASSPTARTGSARCLARVSR